MRLVTKVGCFAVIALLVITGLGPPNWQPRTSLGWQIDHFVGYFVITAGFCLVWRRPAMVAGALAVFAAVLEAAQGLTADRSPNIMAVVYGVGGVLTAAMIAELVMRARRRGSSADIKGS
jgi:VanZ family protein